jgi:hypothetical protein
MFSLCALAQQPAARSGVRLSLSTLAGLTQFHIGQPITVILTFETAGDSYSIATDVPPRRLRPQIPDQFTAEPADGWVDPLKDLQWTMESSAKGMPRRTATLDAAHPVSVRRILNEFVVFREPGHYVVHCTSSRLPASAGAALESSVESSGLALDILPRDAAEEARQFASARATLEAGKPPKEPVRVRYGEREREQTDAVNTLRYLDTEASATYLASIYGQGRPAERDIEYALYASERREAIVRELERRMADPDLTLTQDYLIALTMLKARIEERKTGFPLSTAEWNALDETVNKRVFELAAGKTPQAKAETYYYLYETGSSSYRHAAEMRRLLIESMPYASPFTIGALLSLEWADIKSPLLQPFLKQAASRQWPQMSPGIGGLALLHLAEFDPIAANELAKDTLISGNFGVGDAQLMDFSVPASAQLDRALLSQYLAGKPVEARIARYASSDTKDEFWRAYNAKLAAARQPECATPILAYFFRVDPAEAARHVAESRKAGGYPCTALDFYQVERALMSPGLERQLLQDAKSPVPNIRLEAFRALSLAGSPAALPELLQALEQAGDLKQDLIAAILQGRNWVLKAADYARLEKQCAGTTMCPEIARVQRESAPPYALRLFDFAGHRGVWLYNREVDSLTDLDTLLNQFPAGAVFRWEPVAAVASDDERQVRDRVRVLLAGHGMSLLP